jgi:hypothetical protein
VGWTLIYSATVLLFVFSQIKSLDKERGVHPFMALLTAALMLEYVGIICQTWHGWTYATDGEGLVVLQAVGEVLDACSNLVIMLLLLMMARGWTVSSAAQSVHSRHFSKDWIVSMSLFMTGFLSLFILERTGRAIDARYCYDSDIGLLALMLRNAVFIYFIISLLRSYRIEVRFFFSLSVSEVCVYASVSVPVPRCMYVTRTHLCVRVRVRVRVHVCVCVLWVTCWRARTLLPHSISLYLCMCVCVCVCKCVLCMCSVLTPAFVGIFSLERARAHALTTVYLEIPLSLCCRSQRNGADFWSSLASSLPSGF